MTKKIVSTMKKHTGKKLEDIYGKEKANKIKKKTSKSKLGKKLSDEHKEKIRQGNLGKKLSLESREKLSKTRKQKFADGTLKLSPKAGFGRGGFKKDIGHYVRSSYEHYYAQKLIIKKIKYFYEPKSFPVKTESYGSTQYTPDFFIISENKWIEIKNPYNVKDPLFMDKFKAFKDQYPNEEIEIIVGNQSWKPTIND
jgi:hypothetical protein